MAIGGMEVFGHDYHFGKTPTREGVSKSKGTPTFPTKGKKKGYGGPKNLKPHSEIHPAQATRARPGLKPVGNEHRAPADFKDIPTKKIVSGASGKTTANSSRGDAVKGGYSSPR